jgi:transcription-repair coupling factor (superfamily II helicase)
MKDLEIRGAGNILGPQQSGHIAAVGYDMYCRLLKRAVESLQSGANVESALLESADEGGVELELGLRAFLPEDWIPDARTRLEIHRTLSEIRSDEDAEKAGAMLKVTAIASNETVRATNTPRRRRKPGIETTRETAKGNS